MVPLLVAPHGGMLGDLPVQRTFGTGRSVEFDALLLATAPAPVPDAPPAPGAGDVDPRVLLMVEESWRHAKPIGAWGTGDAVLRRAGVAGTPGVVAGDSATEVLTAVRQLMSAHRVWERFPVPLA